MQVARAERIARKEVAILGVDELTAADGDPATRHITNYCCYGFDWPVHLDRDVPFDGCVAPTESRPELPWSALLSTRPDEFVAGHLQRVARAGRAHARAIEAIGVLVREHEKAEAVIAEDDGRLREIEAELHPRAATRWREHVARGIKLDDIARCAECRDFERCCRCHLSSRPCGCGELLEWRQGADARHA